VKKATALAEWSGMTLLTLGGAALLVRPALQIRSALAARRRA
jgi:hypothetical protein